MKKFITLLLVLVTANLFGGTAPQPKSFLGSGITFIQLKGGANGQGLTNLDSFQKFPQANGSFVLPAITNIGILWTNLTQDRFNAYAIVATNITATPTVSNFVAAVTNMYGPVMSNVFMSYTNLIGPAQAGVHGVTNGNFNLLSTVALANDANHTQQFFPGAAYGNAYPSANTTNSYGTLQFTTIADGTNVCIFTFVAVPDGTNEDTDASRAFSISVTNALGIRTTDAALPILWPGAKAIRLQSITSTGGAVGSQANQVGILSVNLVDDTP